MKGGGRKGRGGEGEKGNGDSRVQISAEQAERNEHKTRCIQRRFALRCCHLTGLMKRRTLAQRKLHLLFVVFIQPN